MKYVSSAEDFFSNYGQLNSAFESFEFAKTPQEIKASLDHQLFLLENFSSIDEINSAENVLIKFGYNPIFLTLEGAYLETLNSIELINEGLLDTIKSFLSTMTEGGNPIAVVQFALDIIGAIPFTWAGVPVDIVANLLNAAIAFYREQYLIGAINLLMAATPGVGAAAAAPLKVALKPVIGVAEKLIATLWKGGAAKVAAADFKAGALAIEGGAHAGAVAKMGEVLIKISEFIATTGIKIIRSIVDFINTALSFATGGIMKVPKGVTKALDELALKMTSFSKGATEAGEALLKEEVKLTKAAGQTAKEVETAAVKAGAKKGEAVAIAREFENIKGLSKQMQSEIAASEAFQKLVKSGASKEIQNLYIKGAMTEKLVGNILAKGGTMTTESLVQILKNPTVAADLAKAGWKGADKVLVDAIAAGDKAGIEKILAAVAATPSATKLLSPRVAQTLSVFREAPELLISGTKKLSRLQDDLLKFTGKNAYKGISGKAYIALILKLLLKGNDCASYISSNPGELDRILKSAGGVMEQVDMNGLASVISKIDEADSAESAAVLSELESLKSSNPDAYEAAMGQINSTKSTVKEFVSKSKPGNPCLPQIAAATAEAGVLIRQPKMYKAKGGGEATVLTTPEDFKDLNEYTKGILKTIGLNADIDPQHPLYETDPYTQAYFSDVVNRDGELEPSTGDESRLDDVLKEMQQAGTIDAARAAEIKASTLDHWQKNTMPASLEKTLNSTEEIKESKIKVGRLNLIK